MSRLRLVQIASVDELRAVARAWDDLWARSEVTLPTCRAELVAEWIEQFAPERAFRALAIEDQGQLVAALPLVGRQIARVLAAAALPANEWSAGGELLLDPAADEPAVLARLVAGLRQLPWPLLWLREVALDAPRWQAFRRALQRGAVPVAGRSQYRVACIDTAGDWSKCRQGWSRKHRQRMSWCLRRLAEQGELRLRRLKELAPADVEPWLRRGFEIEDRSWKGRAGTSVLRTPRMFGFLLRQARQLAQWGQLELDFLESGGRPIAFAYGQTAKGVYHSCKIGYDPQHARYGPGHVLRYLMLEQFHGDPERRALDCQGPLTEAHRPWRPTTYAVGRLVVASRWSLGRLLLWACH